MSGGESIIQCCKEQYCTGTWNVRPMNQGNLDVVLDYWPFHPPRRMSDEFIGTVPEDH